MKTSTKILVVIISALCHKTLYARPNILIIGTDGTAARYISAGLDPEKNNVSIPPDSAAPRPLPEYQSMVNDKHGAFTLDVTSTTAADGQRDTISGANWTSLLTGKEYDKHGVTDNTLVNVVMNGKTQKAFRGYNGTPLLTLKLHDRGYKTRLLAEWAPLVDAYGRYFDEADRVPLVWHDTNPDGTKGEHTAINNGNYHTGTILSKTDANFVFVHIDSVDDDGHTFGWDSSQYAKGVRQLDDKISIILDGLMSRKNINNEEWLVGITPDHGGVNYGHADNKNPLVYQTYFLALHWNKGKWQLVTLKKDPETTIADLLPRLMAQNAVVDHDVTIAVRKGQTLDDISPQLNKDSWVHQVTSQHGLTKTGGGTLLLTDNTVFSRLDQQQGNTLLLADHHFNDVDIGGGKLVVQGTLESPTLRNRATLVNNGTITGNTVLEPGSQTSGSGRFHGDLTIGSGAMIAPGNSIGTLQVAGNVTFASGAHYAVEVAPDGQGDQINSDGYMHIAGGHVGVSLAHQGNVLSQQAVQQLQGRTYPILTAQQGISGRFDQVSPQYLFVGTALEYQPKQVLLHVGRNRTAFASVARTHNERTVARAADALSPEAPVYQSLLNSHDGGEARQAFRALSGQIHADTLSVLISNSRYLRDTLDARLRQAAGQRINTGIKADTTGAWVRLLGAWGHATGNRGATGYQSSAGGVFVGLDTAPEPGWRMGLATGYTHSALHGGYDASAGVDSYHLALYGSRVSGALALRAGAGHSWNRISAARRVQYGAQFDRETAKYNAGTSQLFTEAGYSINAGDSVVEPFARLAWVNVGNASFREKGGAAALNGGKQHSDAVMSVLGGRTSSRWQLAHRATLALTTTLGWQHEYSNRTRGMTLRFRHGTTPFDVNAAASSREGLVVNTGIDLALNPATRLTLGYAGLLSKAWQDNSVNAGFTWRF